MTPPELLYDRLHQRCTTSNQLNGVHIALENRLTPAAARRVIDHVRRRYPEPSSGFATRVAGRVRRVGATGRPASPPEPPASRIELAGHARRWAALLAERLDLPGVPYDLDYRRTWTRGGARAYQADETPSDVLAICFTGNEGRMMMPTPLFLSHLAPHRPDVLMLHVPRGTAYVDGVRGFSSDIPGTLEWLRGYATQNGHRRVLTLGVSGGALIAVVAGLRLGAEATLAAGTRPFAPEDPQRSTPGSDVLHDLLRSEVAGGAAIPRVTLVHGALSPPDERAARDLRAIVGSADIVTVPDAKHGCLFPLVESGDFGPLVSAVARRQHATGRP